MKKTIITITSVLLYGCKQTTTKQDIESLQRKFNLVYNIDLYNHICIDSTKTVYHITVDDLGSVKSTVKVYSYGN